MKKGKKHDTVQRLMCGKHLGIAERFLLMATIEKTKAPYGQIARQFGLTHQAVSSFARRHQLRKGKK